MARRKKRNMNANDTKGGSFRPGPDSKDPESARSSSSGQPAPNGNNDISWYSRYPNLLAAAGSFPYPYKPGMSVDLGTVAVGSTTTVDYDLKYDIPGVMVLDWIPTIGKSNLSTDPASILGKEMYARVRNAYSGTLRADAPDYVIYILALDSIYSYISWLKRVFRIMNTWTPENYLVPDALLHGLGFNDVDIQELRLHRVELWQAINTLVLHSRKFTCPASIDFINRHYWLNDNVFTDAPTMQGQFYLFNQVRYYYYQLMKYEGAASQVGGVTSRVPVTLRTSTSPDSYKVVTVANLLKMGLDMINALNEWDDAYTINGYLMRAYAGDPAFLVDEIALDARFEPVYSQEVLMQIENSQSSPAPQYWIENPVHIDIYQNPTTNAIISNPMVEYTNTDSDIPLAVGSKAIFNMRMPVPTAFENTIASRLKVLVENTTHTFPDETEASKVLLIKSAGSEIPVGWRMVGFNGADWSGNSTASITEMAKEYIDQYMFIGASVSGTKNIDVIKVFAMEAFDWHPIVLAWRMMAGTNGYNQVFPVGDILNLTTVDQSALAELHKICLYSEFNSFGMS